MGAGYPVLWNNGLLHTLLLMMISSRSEFGNLYRKPVFQSRSPRDSQRALERVILPHDVRWGRGSVETALFRHTLSEVSVLGLRYGAPVEVRPQLFQDLTLVQMPLRGTARFESDGVAATVGPGEVVVLSPRQEITLWWEAGCEQIILTVPRTLFNTRAEGSEPLPAELPSLYTLAPALAPQWRGLVQQCLLLPDRQEVDLHGGHEAGPAPDKEWVRHFERTLAFFLVAHRPAGGSVPESRSLSNPDGGVRVACRSDQMRLQQLETYVTRNLGMSLTLPDLARAAGVSPRLLHELCQRHFGLAPMTWVRERRLDRARELLMRYPQRPVTDIALEVGFSHLGRFAGYYRQRFGELPRETGALGLVREPLSG